MKAEQPPENNVLDYASPAPHPAHSSNFNIIVGLVGLFIMLSLTSMFLPSITRNRLLANRVKCASNLRQIGQAILLYCNDNGGSYPPDLQTLLFTEEIDAQTFTCPSSNDTPASGATTQAIANQLLAAGHLSYIYLGQGSNSRTIAPSVIVAYEPLSNHDGSGSNALFGDGHVDFVAAAKIKAIQANAQSSSGPATIPN